MLRYRDKEDIEARVGEVDEAVEVWRQYVPSVSRALKSEFENRLRISLIYHDSALEGDVLTYSEIKAAIDPSIISDATLIPSYDTIKQYYEACAFADEHVAKKRAFKLETIHEIYALLAPEEKEKGYPFRKENPLHRLYYHDIAAPEAIAQEMRRLGKWLEDPALKSKHPIERVAETHVRMMAIFPYAKQSGRCARIISNLLLRQARYPIAVIHSIDRQAYYESLRGDSQALLSIYLEAVQTAALSEMRVYEEAAGTPMRQRA